MAATLQHRTRLARVFRSALLAAIVASPLALLSVRTARAQEPGTPPETQAPESDNSAQAPDDSTPDADDQPQDDQDADQAQPADNAASDLPAADAAPQPELPKWPVNQKPAPATVTWDSRGLAVSAANSSLQQILRDICTATGSKVEGLNTDERIFGEYGPGEARDVLSQLLLGAGYNVMMIGDQGHGAPRQILLTTHHSNNNQGGQARGQANNNNDEDDVDNDVVEEQPVQPPPNVNPTFPGGPPRTPQQIMQERQERMQQMRQQQMILQQQQQNNPQP